MIKTTKRMIIKKDMYHPTILLITAVCTVHLAIAPYMGWNKLLVVEFTNKILSNIFSYFFEKKKNIFHLHYYGPLLHGNTISIRASKLKGRIAGVQCQGGRVSLKFGLLHRFLALLCQDHPSWWTCPGVVVYCPSVCAQQIAFFWSLRCGKEEALAHMTHNPKALLTIKPTARQQVISHNIWLSKSMRTRSFQKNQILGIHIAKSLFLVLGPIETDIIKCIFPNY